MSIKLLYSLSILLVGLVLMAGQPTRLCAQEKDKGELGDFGKDFGEGEDSGDSDSDTGDDATEFFLWAFVDNFGDFVRLWGHTPGTEHGPFPTHPYSGEEGFMASENSYRSYYFNTEFNYHNLGSDLRSYIFKWESQFVHRSKLSFDVSYYEENVLNQFNEVGKDRLTLYGLRYGYALYRTPQVLFNIEGGFRGFHRSRYHGGVEIAGDLLLFPKKPLVIETEMAAAYVSNGPLYTIESSAGIILGNFEILAGFRLLKSENTLLDGYRIGLRIWY